MRTFLVLICTLALACAAGGAQEKNKSKKSAPKKNQTQSSQHAAAPGGAPQKVKGSQHGTTAHHASGSYSPRVGSTAGSQKTKGPQRVDGQIYQLGPQTKGKTKGSQQIATAGGGPQKTRGLSQQRVTAGTGHATYSKKTKQLKGSTTSAAAVQSSYKGKGETKGSQQIATQRGQAAGGHPIGLDHTLVNKQSYTAKYKAKHFNLSVNTRPATVTGVTFQQNRRIVGSQNWQGSQYTAFRNYTCEWHDQGWWKNHYNNVVFVFGGWYAWDAGWWRPAWGFAPNAYYAYDGPIYAYNDLPPDQVIANVQAALQEQGYYQGEVDGLLGPLTCEAIANYQRDHGLYETAAIDRPTLESLGMT